MRQAFAGTGASSVNRQRESHFIPDGQVEERKSINGVCQRTKEHLAGVWVWEAPDLDVALELATEASKVCDRRIEVRPFQ